MKFYGSILNMLLEQYEPRVRTVGSYFRDQSVGEVLLTKLNDKRFPQEFRIDVIKFNWICDKLRPYLKAQPNLLSGKHKRRRWKKKLLLHCTN